MDGKDTLLNDDPRIKVTDRREFLAKFGALTAGGLWIPQISGWLGGNEANLTRVFDRDSYQAVFYSYGRMEFAGSTLYNARKGNPQALRMIDAEIEEFRKDLSRWLGQPLHEVWPEVRDER